MKSVLNTCLFLVLAVGCAQISYGQAPDTRGTTGVATMFARDPLTQSLCFKDGGPGHVFQEGQKRNRCSDLNFHSYSANAFQVGIEGGRDGVILDLGSPAELKAKYGFSETIGDGQGFASIDIRNGKALILKNQKTGELQELAQSAELFKVSTTRNEAAEVKLGHVYLIRITDERDKSFEKFAKILVLAHAPNESVTVRWYLMSNTETAKL